LNLQRLKNRFDEINQFGYSDQGINRLAYTRSYQQAIDYLMDLCKKANMTVRIDAVGNLIARREGSNPTLPAVACGSHIDSVYEGGKYDGTIGVVTALEVIQSLNDLEIETKHPIEIIAFACEESSRFGFSMIGSKAMAGCIKREDLIHLKDKYGISIEEAFSECSLNIRNIELAKRKKDEFKVFLELHIEQGPVLESEEKQVGIVTGIASPTRFKLQIFGEASHSGSTPMHFRKDAFLGSSEIALALEAAAMNEASNGTVATVGACTVKPGAMNVVPGMVEMEVDIRGISSESKVIVIQDLYQTIKTISAKRNLEINVINLCDETPLKMDRDLIRSLTATCESHDISYKLMPSGAGHDAMNMAKLCPTGLIFIPSKNGLSHNPKEYTPFQQIHIGGILLKAEILKWAIATNIKQINWSE
jgi:hydantoinase/carbamoylase family amidase